MLRVAELHDIPQLQRLFREVFHKETGYTWWQWKYFHPNRPALSLVWEEDGTILAHYGGQEFSFRIKGKKVSAWGVTDIMTHPKVRWRMGKRAPLLQLGLAFIEEITQRGGALLFGFPGETSRKYGERFLGYQALFPVEWFYVKKIPMRKPLDVDTPSQPYDLPKKVFPGLIRSSDWITWRFFHKPDRDYTIFSDGRGYVVLYPGEEEVLLLEMGGKPRSWDALLQTALIRLNKPILKGMASPGLWRLWPSKLPFERQKGNFFYCIRPLRDIPMKWITKKAVVQLSDYDVE